MKGVTKPVVLTGLGCAFCLYILLCGSFSFGTSIAICTAVTAVLGLTVAFTSDRSAGIILIFITAVCMAHACFISAFHEKAAYSFIYEQKDKPDSVYTVEITALRSYGSYSSADGKIISCDGRELDRKFKCRFGFYSGEALDAGDLVTFTGTPERPSNDESDGFDNVSYLRSRKIFITFPVCSVTGSEAGKAPLQKSIHKYIEKVIYKFVPYRFEFESADVSYSMLVGDKSFLSDNVKEAFTRSGIIHLLCVSGMHLTVIMGALYSLFKISDTGKRLSAVLMIVFCFVYLAVIGFPISAVRAGIICIIGYCASLLGRSTDAYSSLFASLVIVCLISPYSVIDISAILSFAASLGIITSIELFAEKEKGGSVFSKIIYVLKSMLAANIGAVLFTYLFSANAFGGISLASVPATLLTSFASEILLIFLLITVVLSVIPFLQPLLYLTGFICRLCAEFIISIAKSFANLKFSYTEITNVSLWLVLFIIVMCVLCFFIYFDRKIPKLICFFTTTLICAVVVFISFVTTIADDNVYKVSYFRQNKDDRQACIKLASEGYLIINADDTLCFNSDRAVFDDKRGNNYLLIIPDKNTNSAILASNIQIFRDKYGLKGVFLPPTLSGERLKNELSAKGCPTSFIENMLDFGSFTINFDFSGSAAFFSVDDGKTKTEVLFSDRYDSKKFSKDCDIAAFFTRETKNQFDTSSDVLPPCSAFITRLKKDEVFDKTHNTYGEKSFDIKG